MLKDEIPLQPILEANPKEIGDICEGLLDRGTLAAEVDSPTFTRKRLCEYLGIGESTLSGWLNEDRIPRLAKVAVVLYHVVKLAKEEMARLRREAAGLKILKSGDIYQLCRFEDDDDGAVVGRIVADGIRDIQVARMLSVGDEAQHMLEDANAVIDEMLERTENEEYIRHLEDLRFRIERQRAFVTDYEEWRRRFGKKMDLDSLL